MYQACEEMEDMWVTNVDRNKRFMRCGEETVQELRDRDHRTLSIHRIYVWEILPRGERKTRI